MSNTKVIFTRLLVCDADHLILPATASQVLSASEQARLAGIQHPSQGKLFLLGRYLLRQLLAPLLQQAPSQLAININAKGKPELADTDWHFNISHSGSLLTLAFGNQAPLGVDIETRLLSPAQVQRLAKRYLSHDEQTWLDQPNSDALFLRLWTIKEAVLKAHGSGIANNLQAVCWHPEQDHAHFSEQHYQLRRFRLQPSPLLSGPLPQSRLTLAIASNAATPVELLNLADLATILEISGPQPNLYIEP